MGDKPFSVVIPVYNEEELMEANAEKLSCFLDSLNEEYEIIICDNGSSDSTPLKGESLARLPRVRFLSIPHRRAVGYAFREGVKAASHERIISLDMDLSSSLDFVPRALESLDGCSMVIGSKKERQRRSMARVLISSSYIALVRLLLGLSFSDFSMSSKAYRKSEIKGYLDRISPDSSYVIELAHRLSRDGKALREIAVECDDRRKSRFVLWREVYARFLNLLRLRLSRNASPPMVSSLDRDSSAVEPK